MNSLQNSVVASEEQVRRVLNLEKKLEQTPVLHSLLVNGEVSTNKLFRITAIATKENEEFLATQVQLLPKSALETLVRDEKRATMSLSNSDQNQQLIPNEIALYEPKNKTKSVPGHSAASLADTLNISEEVKAKLLELQQKGIDINDLLFVPQKNVKRRLRLKKNKSPKR